MVDAVTKVTGGGTVAPIGQQTASSSATDSAANSTQAALQTLTQTPPAVGFSHRLYDDPSTGVLVTAQIDSAGHVIQQNPSGFVLAYLRNGLTAQGNPKTSLTT